MKYVYFVSYSHTYGFGNCQIFTNEPITDISNIQGIQRWLREQQYVHDPAIINYQLLRTEKEPHEQ